MPGREGQVMSSYCYSLSLDGDEQPILPTECATAQEAIDFARLALLATMMVKRPGRAYCVVYASLEIGADPLGVWDWSRDCPEPIWSPAAE